MEWILPIKAFMFFIKHLNLLFAKDFGIDNLQTKALSLFLSLSHSSEICQIAFLRLLFHTLKPPTTIWYLWHGCLQRSAPAPALFCFLSLRVEGTTTTRSDPDYNAWGHTVHGMDMSGSLMEHHGVKSEGALNPGRGKEDSFFLRRPSWVILAPWCKKHTTVKARRFKAVIVCVGRDQYCISIELWVQATQSSERRKSLSRSAWLIVPDNCIHLHSHCLSFFFYPFSLPLSCSLFTHKSPDRASKTYPNFPEAQWCFSWDMWGLKTWRPIFLQVHILFPY